MTRFSLDMVRGCQRPVVNVRNFDALIDTGAVIPSSSLPVPVLEELFGAKLVLAEAKISGFGGACMGKVYSLKNFALGHLNFEVLEVFVPNDRVTKYPFLLSATMFYGFEYAFDTVAAKFRLTVPSGASLNRTFRVKDLAGRLFVQVDGVLLQDLP